MRERFIAVVNYARVLRDYRGMDGLILWSAESKSEFENALKMPKASDHNVSLVDEMSFRMLRVVNDTQFHASETEEFYGWDVGHFSTFDSVYSLIPHYLLNNRPGPRDVYRLNSNLLFASLASARALLNEWLSWSPENPSSKEGAFEDDEFGVWALFRVAMPGENGPAVWTAKIQ